MKIVIDTNVFMLELDIFEKIKQAVDAKYQLFAIQPTIDELSKLAKGAGKHARQAKLALQLVKAKSVKVLAVEGYADDILVELSKKGYVIATVDRNLRRRLKSGILVPRQKKYFVLLPRKKL